MDSRFYGKDKDDRMLDTMLGSILRQRWLVILAAGCSGRGVVAWLNLPIDAFPDVTNVQVMILAEAPGLAPERGRAAHHRAD